MAQTQERDPRYGITDAMSLTPPDEKDIKFDSALMDELKAQNEFESAEETATR